MILNLLINIWSGDIRELYSNNITGKIPDELGKLRQLVSLDLYLNQLEGGIPNTLSNLQKLRYLYVWFYII